MSAGSKTAIVGPSGSGKSSLLQLLLKIYLVDSGDIRIANQSISDISQGNLWSVANVVLKEKHFFYGTIRSNLQLAGDELTDEEMEAALQKVKLGHFLLEDPVFEKEENLEQGRIIESGSFAKLVRKKGYFYEMKKLKSICFREETIPLGRKPFRG
ncbi:ATP-binding cassette domain-containing protein [Neobacillus sp. SCS-31]|uniref:ATP-binding cassette domain-containing protein n=1 Tax=Neobacillus oceani TaxID=3115292 RepID=UPI003906CD6A